MAIPLDQARALLALLNAEPIQHLAAQSHAKSVLNEVRESTENFPLFDPQLEDKITFTGYAQLAAGCSLLEQPETVKDIAVGRPVMDEGSASLEAAATLLLNAHTPLASESRESGFHVLVAAMAFYAVGHYSRAFVAIRGIDSTTEASGLIAAFIRKDLQVLVIRLNSVLLRDTPAFEEQRELDEWAVTLAIARSLAYVLEYLFTGDKERLQIVWELLESASVIAISGLSPSLWWVVRLLKLMLRNLQEASLWELLPPLFAPEATDFLSRYVRAQAFARPPVVSLWPSQRAALLLALDSSNYGAVVNLRTSAGKTRVAELAILRALSNDPTAKIVYLAPFRSLAFEIERALTAVFAPLSFTVSHLYGGARVSAVDTELLSESTITIATPEKLRSLFRAFPDAFDNLRLIIIDEGHLIGRDERDVRNEIFIDHLKALARARGARLLLLSAVLPNTGELAEWIAGDATAVAFSSWKPSTERFGLLRWNGSRARIEWLGKVPSFNPSFVMAKPVSSRKNSRKFPSTKNEAIAACAVRLTSIGPAMIFSGRARSIPNLAESILAALGDPTPRHTWPEQEWKVFAAVCAEELEPDAIEFRAARAGVICHSNKLPPQVRMAVEHLMRSCAPKIIIATTTLGQGVNVGISSVIVASPYIGENQIIDKRDFWNICGRAGRAFVDGEGKILYAIDDALTKQRKQWHVKNDESLASHYFDLRSSDRVESGILKCVRHLKRIAVEAGVAFDVLLELVANNDSSAFGQDNQAAEAIWDLLDDELLAMHENACINSATDDSVVWVDSHFQHSLAVIQARAREGNAFADEIPKILRVRTAAILKRIPNRADRKAAVASSLPLSVATKALLDLSFFRGLADAYIASDFTFETLVATVKSFEEWARDHAASIAENSPVDTVPDPLRILWLRGEGLRVMTEQDPNAIAITKDLYGFKLPWIINAVSQKLEKDTESERIAALARIALLTEIGVPSERAAKIFLAGVRSRTAATELAGIDVPLGEKISTIRSKLMSAEVASNIIPLVSRPTGEWLELLLSDRPYQVPLLPDFPKFTLNVPVEADELCARRFENKLFLCTCDGVEKFHIEPTVILLFDQVADNPAFTFVRDGDVWRLSVRDPRLEH